MRLDWYALRRLYDLSFGDGAFDATGLDMSLVNVVTLRSQVVAKCTMAADAAVPDCNKAMYQAIGATAGSCATVGTALSFGGVLGKALGLALGGACTYKSIVDTSDVPGLCASAALLEKQRCMKEGV